MKERTLESITVVIGLAFMLGAGFYFGGDTTVYKVDKADEFTYQHVNFTGTINTEEYEFRFQEKIEKPEKFEGLPIVINGQALVEDGQKIIKLRTGTSAGDIMDTCRHEVLHHYFPSYRHPDFTKPTVSRSDDPIYKLEDQVDLPVCDRVVSTALKNQR